MGHRAIIHHNSRAIFALQAVLAGQAAGGQKRLPLLLTGVTIDGRGLTIGYC